ncbi:MAG: zinc-ribbon domain-containing protein, partial [Polaromonas sp.]|nr:zinc-ribbon domain-containing protein [Polaromonas sp.]
MSLITRCPACGTMFKVVADQLKISQGWVRCGQCSDVFDAAAHLQPRELDLPPPPPVAGTTGTPAASAAGAPPATESATEPVAALSTLLVAPDNTKAAAPAEPAAPLFVPEV